MKSLFDKFVPANLPFRPTSQSELFALRLASKLEERAAVRHFLTLAGEYSEAQLLCAYRRASRATTNGNRGRLFHDELKRMNSVADQNGAARLISIRIERRAVAAAIFDGIQLKYTDSRQLSSDNRKALQSAVAFIAWMFDRFPVESVALEAIANGYEFQRRVIHNAVSTAARDRMLPLWEIPKPVLLESCGHPALRSRAELREIATAVWPVLAGARAKVFIQDAAILGLHVQTERLFILN